MAQVEFNYEFIDTNAHDSSDKFNLRNSGTYTLTTADGDPTPKEFNVGEEVIVNGVGGYVYEGHSLLGGVFLYKGGQIYFFSNNPLPLGYTGGSKYHIIRENQVVCFTAGTMIRTDRGERPVEELEVGDLVLSQDNGLVPVLWKGQKTLSVATLLMNEKFRPIRIEAGALGKGMPERDLVVSPQHRVLVRSKIAERMFGAVEVLVPAKDLLGLSGVERLGPEEQITYVHILCDRHEIVFANGAAAETLYLGPEALSTLGEQLEEVLAIFPELEGKLEEFPKARDFVRGHVARKMVERHENNRKPMVC